MVAPVDRETDVNGKEIKEPRKYLPLVVSYVEGAQKEGGVQSVRKTAGGFRFPPSLRRPMAGPSQSVLRNLVILQKYQYRYAKNVIPFLSPSNIKAHAAKFQTVSQMH